MSSANLSHPLLGSHRKDKTGMRLATPSPKPPLPPSPPLNSFDQPTLGSNIDEHFLGTGSSNIVKENSNTQEVQLSPTSSPIPQPGLSGQFPFFGYAPSDLGPTTKYSFYQVEYYRPYFNVTTNLVICRIKAAAGAILLLFSDSRASLMEPNRMAALTPDALALQGSPVVATFESAKREPVDFYGWWWVNITILFACFCVSSFETAYVQWRRNGPTSESTPYNLEDLWRGAAVIYGIAIVWPLLASFFAPKTTFEEGMSNPGTLEVGIDANTVPCTWRYWASMYGYEKSTLLPYMVIQLTLTLIFGSWIESGYLVSLLHYCALIFLIATSWTYLSREMLHIYFPEIRGQSGMNVLRHLFSSRNSPAVLSFVGTLLLDTIALISLVFIFFRQ